MVKMKNLFFATLSLISLSCFGSGYFGAGGGGSGGTSIGGAVTGGTAGSILFVDPTAILAQDNANLFWDNSNNRLGIGTTTPSVSIDTTGNLRIRTLSTAGVCHNDTSGNITSSLIVNADVSASAAITRSKLAAGTANRLAINDGSGVLSDLGSLGTTTTVLHGNAAGAPTFGAISATTDLTGIVPIANGGTNASSYTDSTGVIYYDGTKFNGTSKFTFDGNNLFVLGNLTNSGDVFFGGFSSQIFFMGLGGIDSGVVRYDDTGQVFGGGLVKNADIDASAQIALTKIDGGIIHRFIFNNSTNLANFPAGTSGQLIQSKGSLVDPAWTTATFPGTATSTGTILRADGTNWVATTATYPATTTANRILYSSATSVVGEITSAATSALVTNSSSVPALTSGSTANRVLRTDGTTVSFAQVAAATDISGTLAIANGGTGQTSASAAFNALSPMTTGGDLIYGGASGVGTRLANGSSGQVLTSNGTTTAPSWQSSPAPATVGFSASATTTAVTNGSTTTLVNPTEDYDPNNIYNNATGVMTVPSGGAGAYVCSASYASNASIVITANTIVTLTFNKNAGSASWNPICRFQATGTYRVNCVATSPVINLSVGDTMRLDLINGSGSTLTGESSTGNYFSCWRVGT